MEKTESLLIVVNSGSDKPYNQYAAYIVALIAKKITGLLNVTVFYGSQGAQMTKKGELAKLAISDQVKELIIGHLEGFSPSYLPDNLELLARFSKDQLGINIASCGTVDDNFQIENFITPISFFHTAGVLERADKIVYY